MLRASRALTDIEARAVAVLSKGEQSGAKQRALGEFLASRGQREQAMDAFERGAKLADSQAANELGKLFLVDGPDRDVQQAAKYLRQASAVGVDEATHLLAQLRVEFESGSKAKPIKAPTNAAQDLDSALSSALSPTDEQAERLRAVFAHLASPVAGKSSGPTSGRLLGNNPWERVLLMQEYVKNNPDSHIGNGLLFASKFHAQAQLNLFEGDINQAIDVSCSHHNLPRFAPLTCFMGRAANCLGVPLR